MGPESAAVYAFKQGLKRQLIFLQWEWKKAAVGLIEKINRAACRRVFVRALRWLGRRQQCAVREC
jgi:hypothetical protein